MEICRVSNVKLSPPGPTSPTKSYRYDYLDPRPCRPLDKAIGTDRLETRLLHTYHTSRHFVFEHSTGPVVQHTRPLTQPPFLAYLASLSLPPSLQSHIKHNGSRKEQHAPRRSPRSFPVSIAVDIALSRLPCTTTITLKIYTIHIERQRKGIQTDQTCSPKFPPPPPRTLRPDSSRRRPWHQVPVRQAGQEREGAEGDKQPQLLRLC